MRAHITDASRAQLPASNPTLALLLDCESPADVLRVLEQIQQSPHRYQDLDPCRMDVGHVVRGALLPCLPVGGAPLVHDLFLHSRSPDSIRHRAVDTFLSAAVHLLDDVIPLNQRIGPHTDDCADATMMSSPLRAAAISWLRQQEGWDTARETDSVAGMFEAYYRNSSCLDVLRDALGDAGCDDRLVEGLFRPASRELFKLALRSTEIRLEERCSEFRGLQRAISSTYLKNSSGGVSFHRPAYRDSREFETVICTVAYRLLELLDAAPCADEASWPGVNRLREAYDRVTNSPETNNRDNLTHDLAASIFQCDPLYVTEDTMDRQGATESRVQRVEALDSGGWGAGCLLLTSLRPAHLLRFSDHQRRRLADVMVIQRGGDALRNCMGSERSALEYCLGALHRRNPGPRVWYDLVSYTIGLHVGDNERIFDAMFTHSDGRETGAQVRELFLKDMPRSWYAGYIEERLGR